MFAALISHGTGSARPEPDVDAVRSALDPFNRADRGGSTATEHAHLVQLHRFNTADSNRSDAGPHFCEQSGLHIVAWARLDNRHELLDRLPQTHEPRQTTDAMLLVRAFRQWDDRCVEHLVGSYSFVVYDPIRRSVFAARDPVGTRPLYYWHSLHRVILATSAAVFHHVDDVDLKPSEEWVARYLVNQSASHDQTAWPGVLKLAGGHVLRVSATEPEPVTRRYFTFNDDPPTSIRRASRWVEAYRDTLEQAVRCRLASQYPIGVETSGGIDSSTGLALAARLRPESLGQLHAFGFIAHEREADFIYETGRAMGLTADNQHIEYLSQKYDPEIEDRHLAILGFPMQHGGGFAQNRLRALADDIGVRTMLSGFGGDEGVTNSAGMLSDELVADHRYLTLMRNVAPTSAFNAIRRAWLPARPRLDLTGERLDVYALRSTVATELRQSEQSSPVTSRDPHRRINSSVIARLSSPSVPTRLEATLLIASAHGIEYRWPLLDVRLIQQYLSTPSIEKAGPMSRYLHRRATQGVVPDKVRLKPTKDMGPPLHPASVAIAVATSREAAAELHPLLEQVVDREKLVRFLDRLELQAEAVTPTERFVASRQALRLRMANRWLHQYH